jgi:hypothetical protein
MGDSLETRNTALRLRTLAPAPTGVYGFGIRDHGMGLSGAGHCATYLHTPASNDGVRDEGVSGLTVAIS